MSLEVSHNSKNGYWKVSYKRHILTVLAIPLIINGFAVLSLPWWAGIIFGILEKSNIEIKDDYQWLVGGSQIIIGLLIIILKFFIVDRIEYAKETDKHSLSDFPIKIESLRRYFSNLVDDHSYLSSLDTVFHDSYTHFRKPENQLQNKKTKKLYGDYSKSAEQLHFFVSKHFFVFPNNQFNSNDYRYCLSPHLNMDRDMTDFDTEKVSMYNEQNRNLIALVKVTQANLEKLIAYLKKIRSI